MIKAGAICNETLNENETSLTMDQFFDFLEPQVEEKKDGKVIKQSRGGAVCQSASDFTLNKTALEKACYLLGEMCDYELKNMIKKFDLNFNKTMKSAQKK